MKKSGVVLNQLLRQADDTRRAIKKERDFTKKITEDVQKTKDTLASWVLKYGDERSTYTTDYEYQIDKAERAFARHKPQASILETELVEIEEQILGILESERAHSIAKAQAKRDHELQVALIQRDTAIAQAEIVRLTAEATAKAQEQASKSLDGFLDGIKNDE